MNWKKVTLMTVIIVLLAIGGYYYQGHALRRQVEELIGQAHSRGLKTDMRSILPEGSDRPAQFTELANMEARREIRRLSINNDNIGTARKLLSDATVDFPAIAAFATSDRYAPRRNVSAGMAVQDYVTLRAALHAESWRGYLLAVDGRFDDAIESTKLLGGLIERLQDEHLPIGLMICETGLASIRRIILKLAQNDSDNVERIERLIVALDEMPSLNFRSVIEFELASSLLLIDEVHGGVPHTTKSIGVGPLQFKVAHTAQALDDLRIKVLRVAIKAHDTWEAAPLDVIDPGTGMVVDDLFQQLIPSMLSTISYGRRGERTDLANRRALGLILEAYKQRAIDGAMPSTSDLKIAGEGDVDPWTRERFTLHEDADGRIWVGARRPDPKQIPPRKSSLVDVLEWRPRS